MNRTSTPFLKTPFPDAFNFGKGRTKLIGFMAILVLSIFGSVGAYAQTVVFTEDFNGTTFPPTNWTRINASSQNSMEWGRATANTYEGAGAMVYVYDVDYPANCWMITPNVNLTAGVQYQIRFWQRVRSGTYPERLRVTVGQGVTAAAQTTELYADSNLNSTTYTQRTANFTPGSTGNYNFGFHGISLADQWELYVDKIEILRVPQIYNSSTTTQPLTATLSTGATNQQIVCIKVVTAGYSSPMTATSFTLSTNGSTSASADIDSAKIFYTGSSNVFATTSRFGGVISPNGTFTITGSVNLNQDTNYFWLAYDVKSAATTNNLLDGECSSITVGGTPRTPTVTAPAGNRQIKTPLSGTYTVGAGGAFATLTAAVSSLNSMGVSGAVTFSLIDAGYSAGETFPITIDAFAGASATNKLTIKPASGKTVVISGSSTSSIIKLNGADFVTIDGSNSGTLSRDLSIINTSTSTNTAVVWLASTASSAGTGCRNVIVSNTILIAGSNTAASTFGIHAGGTTISTTGTGYDHDTLVIMNNQITTAAYGIYARSASGASNDSVYIYKNEIGSDVAATYIGRYGMDLQYLNKARVINNRIKNIITGQTNPVGIWLGTGFNNSTVGSNIISGITYTGTGGYGGKGMTIDGTGATSNIIIANNVIYDILGDGWSLAAASTDPIMGIRVANTVGNVNFYYNTVHLAGNANRGSATQSACLYLSGTLTNIEMRNNTFSNSILNNTTPTGSKAYAIYSALANTIFTSGTNRNNYYASGTQAVLGYLSTADVTSISAWATAMGSPKDANAVATSPSFNSNTVLRPIAISTLLISGSTISGHPTDILGYTRGASTTTIGAYEQGGEFLPPVLTYTNLTNVVATTNRTTTSFATITDASGINNTAGTKPRFYYKKAADANTYAGNTSANNGWKYVEANGTTSPYDFTIDYSKLTGGNVVPGDVIQYFVIAQDAASTPNVTWNNGTFSLDPTSVNLSASNFPVFGSISSYSIALQLSGTYMVGTGQQFTSLTNTGGFFDYINKNAVASDIVVLVSSNTTETGAVGLNQATEVNGSGHTISIQPSAPSNRTISGSITGALVRLNGADRIVIDGRFNGSGSGKYLTITNTSTAASIAAISAASLGLNAGVDGLTIRNCNISTGTMTSVSYGIGLSDGATGPGHHLTNITLRDNVITNCMYGISVYGNLTTAGNLSTLTGNNLQITGNVIGASASYTNSIGLIGIQVIQMKNTLIRNNMVQGINSTGGTTSAFGILSSGNLKMNIDSNTVYNMLATPAYYPFGISVQNSDTTYITGNTVDSLTSTTRSVHGIGIGSSNASATTATANVWVTGNKVRRLRSTGTGGYGAIGIDLNTSVAASNFSVRNNFVSELYGDGDDINTFLYCPTGIRITGNTGSSSIEYNTVYMAGTYSVIYAGGVLSAAMYVGATTSSLNIRNNILVNNFNWTSGTYVNYSIYSAAANTVFSTLNYNSYYSSGSSAQTGFMASNRATLADWVTASGKDANSVSRNITVANASSGDLRLSGASNGDYFLRAYRLGSSDADIDNTARKSITYMGAKEASASLLMTANAGLDSAICSGSSVTIGGSSIITGGVSPYTYSWSSSAGTSSSVSVTPSTTTMYTVTVTDSSGFTAMDSVLITVNALPSAPAAGSSTPACAGNTVNLSVSGNGTLDWYDDASGGSPVNTGATYTTPGLGANDTLWVSATLGSCTSNRTPVIATIANPMIPTTTAPGAICAGNTATLKATTGNGTVIWFKTASSSTPLNTGDSLFTTPVLNGNDSFYVSALLSGCYSSRAKINVTVNAIPAAPSVGTPQAICAGSSTQITATFTAGQRRWYTASTGGSPIHTGDLYTTGALSANTTYYVDRINNACVSATRTPVTVTVNPIPALPTVQASAVCEGSIATFNASGMNTGDVLNWYDAESGGNLLHSGDVYDTGFLTDDDSVYVSITSAAGCSNSGRVGALVLVHPYPAAPTLGDKTVCEGTAASFDFTSVTGNLKWYDDSTAGTMVHSGNVYVTPSLSAATTYYVSATENACEGARTEVKANVTMLPATPTASNVSVCEGHDANLSASSGTADIYWFASANATSAIDTGSSISISGIMASSVYYAEARNGVCANSSRIPVIVVFNSKPNAAYTIQGQIAGQLTLQASGTPGGVTYLWNFGDGQLSSVPNPTHIYTTNGSYNVKLIVANPTTGCIDSTSQTVNIGTVGFAKVQQAGFEASVYPNPFTSDAVISYTISKAEHISIRITDMLGREVLNSAPGLVQPGKHELNWNAISLPAGMYQVNLSVSGQTHILKLVKAQ